MGTTIAGLEGVIAGESEICYIDGYQGVLSYRGYNIHTLADNGTFEEIIFLLWHGWLPKAAEVAQLKKDLVAARPLPGQVVEFLGSNGGANSMDVLRTAVSMLSLYDAEAADMSAEANHRKAVRLMAQTATIVTTFERLRTGKPVLDSDPNLGFAANFLYTLTGKRPDDVMERAFDVALILHADHEFNASTFAARVVAATLSDIHSADKAIEHVKYRLANKLKVPGFGHRVYHTVDPRATHLSALSEEIGKRTGHVELFLTSSRIEKYMNETKNLNANVD